MAEKRRRQKLRVNHPCESKAVTPKGLPLSFRSAREPLILFLLGVLIFLLHSSALRGPFIFDDLHNIQDNPHIRINRLTLKSISRAAFESPSAHRPFANISLALNYYLRQYDVAGYRLVNILIHIVTGIFLYLFAKTTLSIPSLALKYGNCRWIPMITALVWLIHPLQTQSVTYVVQRMNSMAAMFYVLSLLLYAKARLTDEKRKQWALFGGALLGGIFSLGSKQIAATLPVFIFLYEWYFFQALDWSWLKRRLIPLVCLLVFVVVVAFMYLGIHPLEKILFSYGARDFTLTERVLTEFRVVLFYISLLIFPHPSRLNLDHDFPLSHSLIDPITTLLSIVAILGLIGLALYMAKRRPLLSFCILWFFGNLVIESSVIGLEIIFEHRTYLPNMFAILMAVTLLYRHLKPKRLALAVLCAVLALFSAWTYERNKVWRDEVPFWRDCMEKSPNKARPHNSLGVALANRGMFQEAVRHYSEALRIKPDFAKAHNNLANALASQNKMEEAIRHYSEALRLQPDYAEARQNLHVLQSQFNRMDMVN